MLKKIIAGTKHRYQATTRIGMVTWVWDQVASLIRIAFGAVGATLLVAISPKLVVFIVSTIALGHSIADANAVWRLGRMLPSRGKTMLLVLEGISVSITLSVIAMYCKSILVDQVQEAWYLTSVGGAYILSSSIRMGMDFCVKSLEAATPMPNRAEAQEELPQLEQPLAPGRRAHVSATSNAQEPPAVAYKY